MNSKRVSLWSKFQLEQCRFLRVFCVWKSLCLKEEDVDQRSTSTQINSSCSSCFSSQKKSGKIENMSTFAKDFWFCFPCFENTCLLQFKRINLSQVKFSFWCSVKLLFHLEIRISVLIALFEKRIKLLFGGSVSGSWKWRNQIFLNCFMSSCHFNCWQFLKTIS